VCSSDLANSATNDVSVLLGTGDGTFLGEQRFNAGVQPAFVSIGDLNDDGILDLAVANRGSVGSGAFDGVSILLGNGDGTFQNRKGVNAGASPIALSIGDLDGDGTPDLVVANLNSDDVSVLIGKGDGTFHAEGHFSVGDSPVALSIDDMNGDEALDLVVASSATDTIGVLLGNGDGTFQPMISVTVGGYPSGLSTGDLDGDGFSDLAVANFNGGFVSILFGNGDGTYRAGQLVETVFAPLDVLISDFDGDGAQDLAVANAYNNNVSILFGTGDGVFQEELRFAVGVRPTSLSAADLNGDGVLDLAVANRGGVTGGYPFDEVTVLIGYGDGVFRAGLSFGAGNHPSSVSIGDLNGDGVPDLAISNAGNPGSGAKDDVSILLGRGDGHFETEYRLGVGDSPADVSMGDIDADGVLDIVVVNTGDDGISILFGIGDRKSVV